MRKVCLVVVAVLLGWLLAATPEGLVAWADGPTYYGPWTRAQWDVIGLAYEYTDFYGFRDQDRDDFLRMLYRETVYGYDDTGDCYTRPDGSLDCLSIGPAQFNRFGVWWSTPCGSLGLNARWNHDDNIRCAAWAWANGYASHWRPDIRPLGRWPAVVPADPRYWLWGQEHWPGREARSEE